MNHSQTEIFKDHVATPMSFNVVPTSGTDPSAKPVVAVSATPGASVTPKPLPFNQLTIGTPKPVGL